MERKERNSTGIPQFFDELVARSATQTSAEMRSQLLAFTKVRSALSELELKGIQILEPDFVERYELGLAKQQKPASALDFILRKENVELQLEVKCRRGKDILLLRQDFERYHTVLSNNAKTEEILITWVDSDLPSLMLDLSQIQKYLSGGEQVSIEVSLLEPLLEAVMHTFERHRPDWSKAVEIALGKGPRYDARELFIESLKANIERLKATAEMRRYPDRKQVAQSISDSDIWNLERIFDESRTGKLTPEYVEEKLKQLVS